MCLTMGDVLDDGRCRDRGRPTDLAADVQPFLSRQHQVEDDERGPFAQDEFESVITSLGLADGPQSRALERETDHRANAGVVLYDRDLLHGSRHYLIFVLGSCQENFCKIIPAITTEYGLRHFKMCRCASIRKDVERPHQYAQDKRNRGVRAPNTAYPHHVFQFITDPILQTGNRPLAHAYTCEVKSDMNSKIKSADAQ